MPLNKVTADSIADGTVIAADIANGAVTGPKLGLTAINANNIVGGAVTGDKLGATSINANNIVGGTITTTQIASNTISNTNIQTGAIEAYSSSRSTGLFDGMRNRIINGAMVLDQRNAGASVTPASFAYTLDRWQAVQTTASKFSVQQNAGSVTPPAGFTNYLGVTSLSAYSVGAGDTFNILQSIEGFNCADLAWGTSSAKAVTVSFWVRSSLTGTFGGAIKDGSSTNAYPFTYTISAANTWEYKTVNITAPTSGQFSYTSTTNGIGLQIVFGLGAGANFSGTAGAWAAFNAYTATGATSVVGTNGATFYITGCQLEVGSTATSFDYRPYTTELQLCQRYYAKTFPQNIAPANGLGTNYYFGYSVNTVNPSTIWKFPVTMRAAPTVTLFNDRVGGTAGQWNTGSADSANARALGSSTEFVMFDNSAVPLGTTTNWWLGGATAAIEL